MRELQNAVERGAVLGRGDVLEIEDLLVDPRTEPAAEGAADPGPGLREVVDAATERHIREIVHESRGVRAEAARRLGIDRTTLYRLMSKYGIEDPA